MGESENDRQNRLIREREAARQERERQAGDARDRDARIKREQVDEANRNQNNS